MDYVVKCKGVSKSYKLGQYNHKSLRQEISSYFSKITETSEKDENMLWALKNVNFEVPKGECLGIVGKNGSGKSTLLKLITGLTQPTSGTIETKGRIASLLEVGTGFNPELTGRENIYLNAAILGMTIRETDEKIEEIISFAEVERFIDTPVKRYSSGMTVRLAFSVAVHINCDILILDEVLAVGDHFFVKKSFNRIQELIKNKGITTILVSHDEQSIKELCTRVILLENGQITKISKPEAIYRTYLKEIQSDSSKSEFNSIDIPNVLKIVDLFLLDHNLDLNKKNEIIQSHFFYFCFCVKNITSEHQNLHLHFIMRSETSQLKIYFGNQFQKGTIRLEPETTKKYKVKLAPLYVDSGLYSLDLYMDNVHNTTAKNRYKYQDCLLLNIHPIDNTKPSSQSLEWHRLNNNTDYGNIGLKFLSVVEE